MRVRRVTPGNPPAETQRRFDAAAPCPARFAFSPNGDLRVRTFRNFALQNPSPARKETFPKAGDLRSKIGLPEALILRKHSLREGRCKTRLIFGTDPCAIWGLKTG